LSRLFFHPGAWPARPRRSRQWGFAESAGETRIRLICESCDRTPPAWDAGRSAVAYEGVGRQVTMAFKHADRLDLAAPLARWMTGAGADILHSDMLVIPVPLHWSRLVKRRFNQSALLARHVSARIGADVDVQALSACSQVCREAGAATVSVLTLARVARAL